MTHQASVWKWVVAIYSILSFGFILTPGNACAELRAVSGFDDDDSRLVRVENQNAAVAAAYSLSNGFPIWYEDANGLRLALCLDRRVEINPGVFIDPCLLENNPANPASFPGNFGNEALWWAAETFGTFQSRLNGNIVSGGNALMVLALEAAFAADLGPRDGDQVAFSRIRLRISVPVTGTYRVEHPFGTRDYAIVNAGLRSIDQTQDLGNFLRPGPPPSGDYTIALFDLGAPPSDVADPFVDQGVVNLDGRSIGPFLRPDAPPIVALNGRQYIANPGTDLAPVLQPVIGAPGGNPNALRITLLDPPEGFFLNAADNSQTIVFQQFRVMGKIFADGPNQRPTAVSDHAGTGVNRRVRIAVAANDTDPTGDGNVHGIDPTAIGLPVVQTAAADLRAGILLTQSLVTPQGGTVKRDTTIPTGETVFEYTPPTDFVGEDYFYYVIQDTGGLISQPALVTVVVEDLKAAGAAYRTRSGKWGVAGTSTDVTDNTVRLFLGPRAGLDGGGQVPPVQTGARGQATVRLTEERIDYRFEMDSPAVSGVTQASIHVGGTDENGPVILLLYDDVLEPPFTGSKTGTLTLADLIPRPERGVSTFADAVAAIRQGRTYIHVISTAHPGGEIRGQLELVALGAAQVAPDGQWSFLGKSPVSPGRAPRSVNVESSNGFWLLGVPLVVH
jgi:hypothetical protein